MTDKIESLYIAKMESLETKFNDFKEYNKDSHERIETQIEKLSKKFEKIYDNMEIMNSVFLKGEGKIKRNLMLIEAHCKKHDEPLKEFKDSIKWGVGIFLTIYSIFITIFISIMNWFLSK